MHRAGRLVTASITYTAFSAYLFYPYLDNFSIWSYLYIINPVVAAIGCFILSRRWVVSFIGSFFAGSIYGFGPFVLFLGRFHPTSGSIASIVPWLFIPMVFFRSKNPKPMQLPLLLLAFAAIPVMFVLAGLLSFYPLSIQLKVNPAELYCLFAPAALVNKVNVLVGFYHVPIASLIIGTAMVINAKRYSIFIILIIGLVLTFCPAILGTSSIIWLTIPLICFCVFIGEGTDGLIYAGYNDRKWVLAIAVLLLACAIITLVMGTKSTHIVAGLGLGYTRLFIHAVKMYVLGAIAMIVIFFLAKGKSRLLWLRTLIISLAMGVDIFLGARYIVDNIHR